MAVGIDVFFTGLMLICLDGQPNCPIDKTYPYANTAWVVKADGPRKVCGWYLKDKTKLELKFKKGTFRELKEVRKLCKPGKFDFLRCELPAGDICLEPSQKGALNSFLPPGIYALPRIDEIDRRLIKPDEDLLNRPQYVSAKIHFPYGAVSSGTLWRSGGDEVRWYRSNGDADQTLPRKLSDRLKVSYPGLKIFKITNCKSSTPLITLEPILGQESYELIFQNFAEADPMPDYDKKEGYDALAYTLWYYRLSKWDTRSGTCPNYSPAKKSAVVLRCVWKPAKGCTYDSSLNADNRYWPPMLGPRY